MFLSGCLAHSRMKATRALPSCSWWGGESGGRPNEKHKREMACLHGDDEVGVVLSDGGDQPAETLAHRLHRVFRGLVVHGLELKYGL